LAEETAEAAGIQRTDRQKDTDDAQKNCGGKAPERFICLLTDVVVMPGE